MNRPNNLFIHQRLGFVSIQTVDVVRIWQLVERRYSQQSSSTMPRRRALTFAEKQANYPESQYTNLSYVYIVVANNILIFSETTRSN